MLQVGLTHIHLIADGWQYHIRENTSLLGTVATGPVKLLHRDFQSAKVLRHSSRNRKDDPTDIPQLLNRPFSVGGGIANDKTALIILDCTGENLARTGAEFTGHHDERTVPGHSGNLVVQSLFLARRILDLNHGALINEQSSATHSLGQTATTVRSQIKDHRVDALFLELFKDSTYISSGALVIGTP